MTQERITHATFSIERTYPQPQKKAFEAFSDPEKKRQWFAEGEGFEVQSFHMDFRILGKESCEFSHFNGPEKFTHGRNDTVYMDIVENQRIVIAYIMTFGEHCISSSQASMEFIALGEQTRLIFTEQVAFFDPEDGVELRKGGTNWLLDKLGRKLDEWA